MFLRAQKKKPPNLTQHFKIRMSLPDFIEAHLANADTDDAEALQRELCETWVEEEQGGKCEPPLTLCKLAVAGSFDAAVRVPNIPRDSYVRGWLDVNIDADVLRDAPSMQEEWSIPSSYFERKKYIINLVFLSLIIFIFIIIIDLF